MKITKRMKSKKGNCYIGAVNDGIKWPDPKQLFKGECPQCGCKMTYEDWMERGCPNCDRQTWIRTGLDKRKETVMFVFHCTKCKWRGKSVHKPPNQCPQCKGIVIWRLKVPICDKNSG